jgi:KIX domain
MLVIKQIVEARRSTKIQISSSMSQLCRYCSPAKIAIHQLSHAFLHDWTGLFLVANSETRRLYLTTHKTTTGNMHPTATAYAVVPDKDDDASPAVAVIEAEPLGKVNHEYHEAYSEGSAGLYASAYTHIPEARNLKWTDSFFAESENDGDIIAAFDFDYDGIESYFAKIGWTVYGTALCLPTIFTILTLGMYPCFIKSNASWSARARHVAVTRDGIRFVVERHPTCYGSACSDAGKVTKIIPFDQITDCSVHEAAGNTFCWIPNVLHTVRIDTASSGGDGKVSGLGLFGLKHPHSFQKLVWAMKRLTGAGNNVTAAGVLQHMERDNDQNSHVVTEILREIRDELRQQRALLSQSPEVAASGIAHVFQSNTAAAVTELPKQHAPGCATLSPPPQRFLSDVPTFQQRCLNGGWQSDQDYEDRRKMIAKIVQLLQQRKPNAPADWLKKLPQMAKRLEESLYRSAKSFDEYNDSNTLKHRLQQLALNICDNAIKIQQLQEQQRVMQDPQQKQQPQQAVPTSSQPSEPQVPPPQQQQQPPSAPQI